jgi:hypothetical protein
MTDTNKDERAKPQGGIPTPSGVKVERKEGRVGAADERVGGEVAVDKYSNRNK